jgi:hypothetical protein
VIGSFASQTGKSTMTARGGRFCAGLLTLEENLLLELCKGSPICFDPKAQVSNSDQLFRSWLGDHDVRDEDFCDLFQVSELSQAIWSSPLLVVQPLKGTKHEEVNVVVVNELAGLSGNLRLGILGSGRHGRPHAEIRGGSAIDHVNAR